jgi:hypothetical protein
MQGTEHMAKTEEASGVYDDLTLRGLGRLDEVFPFETNLPLPRHKNPPTAYSVSLERAGNPTRKSWMTYRRKGMHPGSDGWISAPGRSEIVERRGEDEDSRWAEAAFCGARRRA